MPSRILRLWNPDVAAWEEVGDSRLSAHLGAADPHPGYATDADLTAHTGAADPHPQYLTAAEGTGAFLPLAGGTLTGDLVVSEATPTVGLKLAADTQPRSRLSDTALAFGPGGTTAPDTTLTRTQATTLALTGDLVPNTTNVRALGANGNLWTNAWVQQVQASLAVNVNSNGGFVQVGLTGLPSTGGLRLRNAADGAIAWRNAANTANLTLTADASDRFTFTSDLLVSEATPTVSLKQAADTQPRAQLTDTALAFGPGGATAPDTTLYRAGTGNLRSDGTLSVVGQLQANISGAAAMYLAPIAGNPGIYFGPAADTSLSRTGAQQLAANATLALTPATGATGLTVNSSGPQVTLTYPAVGSASVAADSSASLRLSSPANVVFASSGGYAIPYTDNFVASGHPSVRYTVVYAVAGTINTSSRDVKEGITPLDPAACAQAVLETDWLSFEYRPPPLPPGPPGETVAQSTARVKAHSRAVQETAVARTQRGYVLQSGQHRVSELFGLSDRKSASPQADLAVVACALQDALRRIAQLEGTSLEGADPA